MFFKNKIARLIFPHDIQFLSKFVCDQEKNIKALYEISLMKCVCNNNFQVKQSF